jgi:hypothetical protein
VAGRRQGLWRRFLACRTRVAVESADNKTDRRIDLGKFVIFRSNLSDVLNESPIAAELIHSNPNQRAIAELHDRPWGLAAF